MPQKMNEASDAAVMGQVYSVKNEQEKDLTLLSLHLNVLPQVKSFWGDHLWVNYVNVKCCISVPSDMMYLVFLKYYFLEHNSTEEPVQLVCYLKCGSISNLE